MKKNLFNLQNTKKLYQQLLLLLILFFSGNVWGQTAQALPYSFNPGLADLTSANGWVQSGIGSDYADTPVKVKFDTQGDNAVLRIASTPGTLTYYLKNNSLSGSYSFQVFESIDGSTWGTAIQTITSGISSATGGTQWTVNLSSTTRYIKWQYTTKPSGNIGMGTIAISSSATCSSPTSPTTTGITSSAATLGWTAPTSAPASGYQYYLSTSSTAPDASTTPTGNVASGTSVNVNVSANTTYYWWVRSNCSTADKSSWVAGGNFTTPCSSVALPMTEGFNSATIPTCWTQQYVTGTSAFSYNTSGYVGSTSSATIPPQEGTRFVYWNSYNYSNGNTTRLITQPLNSTGISDVQVDFYWYHTNLGSSNLTEGVQVQYSLDGTTWIDAGSFIRRYDANTGWSLKKIILPSGAGNQGTFYVGFKFVSNFGYNCSLDNVTVKQVAADTTVTPTSLTGFTATTASDSPQQSFTVSGATLGSNNITITPPTGYQISTTSGSGYSSTPIVLTPTSGTVASTTIYVVLKKNSTTGAANGSITVSASPAVTPDKTVSLTGTISKATFTSANSGNWETAANWDLNAVPSADDNVVILAAHTITATTAQTRNSGTTTTVSGVLATNDSYLNNGTTTINGTFQINANGWGGGSNDFVYGSSGNLIFAHNNGSEYGSIDATHRYWPATSGPVNVTINSNSPINLGVARTVTGILQVAAGFRNLANITIGTNGTLRLNSGYSWLNSNSSPIYGTSSTLIYNSGGSSGRSNEWTSSTGMVGTTAGLPQNVQLSNNTTLNFPNGSTSNFRANGILTIDSGSSLYQNYSGGSAGLIVGGNLVLNGNLGLGSNEGGDITVGGNWTQAAAANFYPNGRKVIFNGTIAQSIQKVGGGAIDFDRIEINKTNANNVSISNSTGNLTDININGTSSNVLSIIGSGTGSLNLQNRTLTFNNNGGFIYVDAAKAFTATSGAIINVNGSKAVANNSGTGTLSFPSQVTINLNQNGVFDFGKSTDYISTVNGTVNINHSSAYVNTNPPIYATGSKLVYKSGGTYGRRIEWSTTTGAGYPYDVQVTNNTTLDYPNTGASAFNTSLGITNDLTIDSGSSLYMSYGDNGNKSGSLTIGRNIVNSGNFSLGNAAGGDLNLGGNWTSSGTFIPNDRAVAFSGTNGSDQTINSATTFDYLTINKTGLGSVSLSASVIVNKNLNLINKSIVLGANNLTLPNKTSVIASNSSSYINATGVGKLVRQNLDSSSDWVFPMGVAANNRYAPITIKNLSGTTDISVNVNTAITPTVSDATRVLNTKWFVTTTNNVTANIYTEWQGIAAETGSMTIPATGSLGTTVGGAAYTFYSVNLVANNTTATGVIFSNTAANGIVIGNDNAIALANDDCSGANNIVINAAAVTGTVVGATQSLAPTCGGSVASDVWYKFTTTDAAYYKIDVQGAISGFDAVLDLRSGACNGTSIACADATGGGAIETITQLLDANTTYYYRVYRYSNSTIANYSFTTSVTSLPTIIATPTTLAFGNVSFDTNSDKTFAVKGSSLSPANGNISIAALSGYSYSLDGITYSSTIDVPYTGGNLSEKTIHVRFHPTLTCTDYNGNIVLSGGGATSVNVSVIGKGVVSATVATDITASTFTANWNAVAGAVGYELDVYKKVVNPNATELFISEYVEGSSNNRYIEIFNGTGNTVDLSDYQLRLYANGSSTPTSLTLSGNLENNSTIVYKNNLATIYTGTATVAATVINYNGNDAVALYKVSTASNVDIFGKIGNDPGTAWTGAGGYSTLDKTLRRKSSILNGVTVNPAGTGSSAFTTLTTEWDVYNIDNISGLGSHDFDGGTKYTYIVQDENVGNVTSHTITGLDANTEYYYVVRAITATCESSNSNEIKVTTTNTIIWNNNAWTNTTGPNTTLDAIIRTPYYVKANSDEFAVHNLTIENTGLLKIKSGHRITVSGDITTPDNKIIIESEASLTQTKIANGNSNNKAISKRNVKMKTLDYTYWSSPLQDQILLNTTNVNAANSSGGFSAGTPNNRTYEYNEVTDNFKATTNATFVPAKGYAIRGKSTYGIVLAVDSLTFNGNLHNGDYSIQIQKSKNTTGTGGAIYEHGYNLIGNPYPSNINFIKLYNLDQGNGSKNSDVIYGKAWFWTNFSASGTQAGSSYAGNNYATITLAGGTSPTSVDSAEGNPIPNEFIKVAQGFIVQMRGTPPTGTTPNLGIVKFDNSIRTNNNTGHFYNNNKNADEEISRYWVKIVSPYNIANTILIAHMDGATNNYDADYDADLLAVGDDSFYSKVNTQKLQIQARNNPLNNEDVIALGTKHAMSGLYKISLGNREGIFAGSQKIYLRDKLTETYTDLTIQDYSFIANQGIDDNRFEIVYKNKEVLGSESIGKSDFLVYRDGNNFVVKSSNNLGKVELYDVTGKLVQSRYSSDKEVKFDSSVLISGVYIIKAENSGNIRTKKIIK